MNSKSVRFDKSASPLAVEPEPRTGTSAILAKRLDAEERRVLKRCENIIAKGAGQFVRVGLADGQAAASYEYGPFGEVIRETGARGNPFGFSTKYWDETGLLYYGYRYYNASMGRWVSRDPLDEEGSQGK